MMVIIVVLLLIITWALAPQFMFGLLKFAFWLAIIGAAGMGAILLYVQATGG